MKKLVGTLIVVEGKSDTRKIQQYYDVETFETSGMGLRDDMIKLLVKMSEHKTVIVLTDPDMPGEHIRNRIITALPQALHIILTKDECRSPNGRKLGIEFVTKQTLEKAFAQINFPNSHKPISEITHKDLIDLGLLGLPTAKQNRDSIAQKLHLGKVNAKQFLKRVNFFGITRSQLEKAREK
ncbi:MAG: ribonuclease M5 [Culicoidibacterales bacterium]